MRIARLGLMILLATPAGITAAQAQQDQTPPQPAQQQPQRDPVADAARRAREQKKDQPKAAKVFDNDSVPTTPGGVNVVGQSGTTADNAANSPTADQAIPAAPGQQANGSASASSANAADNVAISAGIDSAKEQLKSLQKDLDILQRTFTLDQQMFLVKPDHDADRAGAAKLKDEQQQIADKQQEVADAQKRIDELQSKLGAGSTAPAKQ